MLIHFGLELVHGQEVEGSIWTLTVIRVRVCMSWNKILYEMLSYIFVLRFSQTIICNFGRMCRICSVLLYVALAIFRMH
jgi:hypothetical protein